jgi:hypothetical protein
VLRERSVGESLWESVLPAELRELPPELGKVDAILDEPLLGAVPRAADGAEWAVDDPDRDVPAAPSHASPCSADSAAASRLAMIRKSGKSVDASARAASAFQ